MFRKKLHKLLVATSQYFPLVVVIGTIGNWTVVLSEPLVDRVSIQEKIAVTA